MWVDIHRKCIVAAIAVSLRYQVWILGAVPAPHTQFKIGEKNQRKKPLSSLSSWSPLSLFIVQYLYNPVISLFLPLSPSGRASPTEAILCLLWVLIQASWAGPVSGHGRYTLPEWVTGGPLGNPGKWQYLLPRSGGSRSLQTSLWTPRPYSPLPLENWKEEDIPLLTEGCLSGLPRSRYRQVFVWQGPVFRKMFELQLLGICSLIYISELAASQSFWWLFSYRTQRAGQQSKWGDCVITEPGRQGDSHSEVIVSLQSPEGRMAAVVIIIAWFVFKPLWHKH